MNQLFSHFRLEQPSSTKHEMLVNGIIEAIASKHLRRGQALPSVNDFMRELSLSRMTIVKALSELRDRGIIESKNRVGYFVRTDDIEQQLKVMLVLTAFSSYHEVLHNALLDELRGKHIAVDLFFHHGNIHILRSILKDHMGQYSMYVITPIPDREVIRLMGSVPENKLLQIVRPVCSNREISHISQDFYEEVITALDSIKNKIRNYEKFILVFPKTSFHSPDIIKAFTAFCTRYGISNSVQERIDVNEVRKNTAYFVIEDSHLISLIKTAEDQGFSLGEDLGILSYNDTPMKEIIRQGITVISTDFDRMGRMAARFILNREPVREIINTKIILRNSL